MLLWVKLLIVGIAFAAGSAAGWQVRSWKARADDADRIETTAREQAREFERRSMAANTAAARLETSRAAARARERAIAPQVAKVVAEPAGSCLSDDAVRVLNADIDQRDHRAAGQPAPAVRAAAGSGRR